MLHFSTSRYALSLNAANIASAAEGVSTPVTNTGTLFENVTGFHFDANNLGQEWSGFAIVDDFGIEATGRNIVVGPNGETLPEYAVVDWDKARRAIANPYGSKNQTAGVEQHTWSVVKRVCR